MVSAADWVRNRKAPFYIAHRGAGTTVPEHSLPGYLQALDWGAVAIEISVVLSKDGVLYCHHDLELDRTTTLTGQTSQTASATFDSGRINIPRLGPAWQGEKMPPIPRLDAVLDRLGTRAVLCIEAKDDRAYEPMMNLLRERGLLSTVVAKVSYPSSRIEQARAAGIPVFGYLGSADQATPKNVATLASRLGSTDLLVLPARRTDRTYLDEKVVRAAVATGIPVGVFPIHRHTEVDYFAGLGVTGMVSPALGYLSRTSPVATADHFGEGRLAVGVTTSDPYSDWQALGWGSDGAVFLAGSGERYVCLGDLSPVPFFSYKVDLEVSLRSGTLQPTDAFVLGLGCPDDRYLADSSGYEARLTGDGRLQLLSRDGGSNPRLLAEAGEPIAPLAGTWSPLRVTVEPGSISWGRPGTEPVEVTDRTWRGGYLHVGRSSGASNIAFRNIVVSRSD
jgi:glycerophosphoryl diester phosphodiesterase